MFFLSSKSRNWMCSLVHGVQTFAFPISSYYVILAVSCVAAGLKPGKVRFSLECSDKEQVVDGQPGTATGSSDPLLRWTVSDDGAFPDSVGEDQIVQIAMPDQFAAALNLRGAKKALEIGRARVGKECISTCRSRWSP